MTSFRKRGPYQWQAQIRQKGQPLLRPRLLKPARLRNSGPAKWNTKWTGASTCRVPRRNPLRAYHVHVQLGCVAQGLPQHLTINYIGEVWRSFRSWLRTMNEAMPPSELVVANALRTGLPGFFAVCDLIPGLKKIVGTYRRYDEPHEDHRVAA